MGLTNITLQIKGRRLDLLSAVWQVDLARVGSTYYIGIRSWELI